MEKNLEQPAMEGMAENQDYTILWYKKSMFRFKMTKFSDNCTQIQIIGNF